MQHVQSYFPLEDDKGDLLPRFIALRDGGDEHLDTVIAGWESVLRAKLIDARFFYEQDLKRPLADRVEDLRAVVFQEKLGTVYDKMERLRRVARAAAEQAGLGGDDAKLLDRAALLCKADLTTTMVGDLPTLQGLIGREYALAAGEQAPVADAIGEHHRPRFADDALPETTLGRLLAVADKLDTLAALFAIGLTPTGSADPFGLRREAYGLVNILSAAGQAPPGEQRFHLHISELTRHSLAALSSQVDLERSQDDTMAGLLAFLRERLTVYLREQGIRYDLVDAALAVGLDDISLAERRARALRELLPQPDFLPTVIAATRPMNISADFEGGEVQAGLFKEEAERELWQAYQQVLAEAETADLMDLFALFGRLRAPIDRYFDDVLVMHEDHKLRQNRLSMCWHISQLFRRLAEFSLVVQP
jgi:glycyl-tRNA synthetase beta chain